MLCQSKLQAYNDKQINESKIIRITTLHRNNAILWFSLIETIMARLI